MEKSHTTVSNPVMSIVKGEYEKAVGNLAKVQPASAAEQFTIASNDGSAVIVGYRPGKLCPSAG